MLLGRIIVAGVICFPLRYGSTNLALGELISDSVIKPWGVRRRYEGGGGGGFCIGDGYVFGKRTHGPRFARPDRFQDVVAS